MSALSIFRRLPSKSNKQPVDSGFPKLAFNAHLNQSDTSPVENPLPALCSLASGTSAAASDPLTAEIPIGLGAPTVYMKLPDAISNEALSDTPRNPPVSSDAGRIHQLPTSAIIPNPNQPRKFFADEATIRLADSIRQYGILQPLSVRRIPCAEVVTLTLPEAPNSIKPDISTQNEAYELIAGERRLRAAKLIGLESVPAIIIDVDDKTSAELAIIENLQREDLNIFEQAGAISSLIDVFSLTQEEAARRLSTSQSYVANKLRLLRLTMPEREAIIRYSLTERHARALLKFDSPEKRLEVIEYIASKNLNVAAAEDYIDRLTDQAKAHPAEKLKGRRRLILKDIRFFYNTIDRALETVRSAGIDITSEKTEADGMVELTIRIPNQYQGVKTA